MLNKTDVLRFGRTRMTTSQPIMRAVRKGVTGCGLMCVNLTIAGRFNPFFHLTDNATLQRVRCNQ